MKLSEKMSIFYIPFATLISMGGWVEGMHPEDLYKEIGLMLEKATEVSNRL